MTDVSRLRVLRYGPHSGAYDFTGSPSLAPLRPTDDADSFLPRSRTAIDRPLRSLSGRRYEHVWGAQDVADLVLALEFRGVNNNTGGAVSDWEAKMEQGELLASLFGANAAATTGAAPTVAASGHTPASGILEVSGTTTANGQVIAFATDAGLQIGRIASGGGTTTLTLEHPYSGTPTTGATVFRLAVWTVDDDLTDHVHTMFDAEGQNWRRKYFGCIPMSMEIGLPTGERATFTSTWGPTTWSPDTPADPAHAEPTAGSPIVVDRIKLLIDGVEFIAQNVTIRMDNAAAPRTTSSRENGRLGGVCAATGPKTFTIEGEFYVGDNAGTFNEVEDNDGTPELRDFTGDNASAGDISTTREVALQVGTEIGACLYALLPTADFVVTVQTSGPFTVGRFVATGTGATPAVFAVG